MLLDELGPRLSATPGAVGARGTSVGRMCGRYASSRQPEDLVEEFEVDDVADRRALEPDYNVAPTKEVYAVVERPPHASEQAEEPPAAPAPGR